jgi:hypothetical protein
MFVAGGQGTNQMYSSTNGQTWTTYGTTAKTYNFGVAYYGGKWYAALGDIGGVYSTTNGTSWTATTAPLMASARAIASAVSPPPPSSPNIQFANMYSNGSAILSFTQSGTVSGYYYSTNGGTSFTSTASTTSPIVITGLSVNTSYPISLMAYGSGGNSSMANVSIGNAAVITRIIPGFSKLSVVFNPSAGGTAPVSYYTYSIDGGNTFGNIVNSNISPIVISNISGNVNYSVSIQAVGTKWAAAPSTAYVAPQLALPSQAFTLTYAPVANANIGMFLTNPNVFIV